MSNAKLQSDLPVNILNDRSFNALKEYVSEKTLKAIEEMGFTTMTDVQVQCIPHILEGKDIIGAAKTGSGKTLAFLIPVVELMHKLKFKTRNGTGAIIISPTRELSMQTYEVLKNLMKHHTQTFGLIMGGTNRKQEAKKLGKGINILVATPGRLLDHLNVTPDFHHRSLQFLVIDEADRILQDGFEEEMKQIIAKLPKTRQTLLFSATQSQNTDNLIKLSFQSDPIYIGVDDNKQQATVESLQQSYIVCPPEKRFLMLFTLLKKHSDKKIMVFMSACKTVEFYYHLLNYIQVTVLCIHGKQEQSKRSEIFRKFSKSQSSILLCTGVASRGLDFPAVDWIIQYDPPDDPKEYIHRVGRTARGLGTTGHALLFLLAEELEFLNYLKQAKVPINECEINWKKVSNIQAKIEGLINSNNSIHKEAVEAYNAYVRSYGVHSHKNIFNIANLHFQKTALSFGLTVPPRVDRKGGESKKRKRTDSSFKFDGGSDKRRKMEKTKILKSNSSMKDKRMFTR